MKKTSSMKAPRCQVLRPLLLVAIVFGIGFCQAPAQEAEREGNFDIRFEPTATLQTGVPIPFQILVKNPLRKPVAHAKVTLQIETKSGSDVQSFPAPEIEAGTYIAKPVFRTAGEWSIYVEVTREGAKSARTIPFQVSD